MANTRNTNLWGAITTRLGSLVYILTQTPASERTCTVHQVLVESLKECSDPGTCTAPGCLLDSKAIIGGICKKWFSRTHSSPNLCCLPWNAKGQRRNHHASPLKNVDGTDSMWRQANASETGLKSVWKQSIDHAMHFLMGVSNYQTRIRKLHLCCFLGLKQVWNSLEPPVPPAIRTRAAT